MPAVTLTQRAHELAEKGKSRYEASAELTKAVYQHELDGDAASVRAAIDEVYGPESQDQPQAPHADTDDTVAGAAAEDQPTVPTAWHYEGMFDSPRSSCPPHLAPVLVPGLLRLGHTGLLVARAKSGKSWGVIALAIAVATGSEWMGRRCKRGRVLFVNPEIDPRSLSNRFRKVADAMGADLAEVDGRVTILTLRGRLTDGGEPMTLSTVAGMILEAAEHFGGFDLIIIDSCSTLLTGDENNSLDVRRFHDQCLIVAAATGAAVMCVHHEGKAQSGDRDAIARGRGSSAWGDAFDLVLSLVEVFPPSGDASDYLGEGERAFLLECAAIREFAQAPDMPLIWHFPTFRQDAENVTEDWKPKSAQRTGAQRSGEIKKQKAAARADQCTMALLSHMYREDVDSSEGIPATTAAKICTEALGENIKPQTLKQYVESSEWLDVYQKSPQRWAVVPRHPRPKQPTVAP